MTHLPPPQPGYLASTHQAAAPRTAVPYDYRPTQAQHVAAQVQTHAPTLGQYIRSDSRVIPGRKKAKWAGRAAFWLGMLAAVLFFGDLLVTGGLGVLAAFATPIGVVAILFGLVAVIAGIGRGSGIFGLIFALAGSTLFWSWLERTFG